MRSELCRANMSGLMLCCGLLIKIPEAFKSSFRITQNEMRKICCNKSPAKCCTNGGMNYAEFLAFLLKLNSNGKESRRTCRRIPPESSSSHWFTSIHQSIAITQCNDNHNHRVTTKLRVLLSSLSSDYLRTAKAFLLWLLCKRATARVSSSPTFPLSQDDDDDHHHYTAVISCNCVNSRRAMMTSVLPRFHVLLNVILVTNIPMSEIQFKVPWLLF